MLQILFQRLIDYIRQGLSAGVTYDISEPLLIFILYVLKSKENIETFHQVGGFKVTHQ